MNSTEIQTYFYEQLYKSLDDDSDNDNETELCQITGLPLESKCVTLECNHKFNYEPLYNEICKQKYVFNSYLWVHLSYKEKYLIKNKGVDYFIRCPYCRNIQLSVLPYYEELGLQKKYGINSLDITLPNKVLCLPNLQYSHDNKYIFYGKLFKNGICSETECPHIYVTPLNTSPDTVEFYCKYHYKNKLNTIKIQKQKVNQELLDKKNEERTAQGLKPLKRLPPLKKQNVNVVQIGIQVGTYIPEDDPDKMKVEPSGCSALLKTGLNKGKQCDCKKIEANGLCKRHQVKGTKDEGKEGKEEK